MFRHIDVMASKNYNPQVGTNNNMTQQEGGRSDEAD